MTSSQPFECTMASNTSWYCSQFDFPEYLGTGVDVNPDRLGGRPPEYASSPVQAPCGNRQHLSAAGPPPFLIAYSGNTAPLSHLYLVVVWISVFLNTLLPEAWLSGMSLPDVVLSGPSDVNKARFRGISHRLSLWTTVSSGI